MFNLHVARLQTTLLRALPQDDFVIPADRLEATVVDQGLGAFVVSNPCNPTGGLVQGDDLARWVQIARDRDVTLLLDEFYSHFIYNADGGPANAPVSAAAYVEDVNEDPIALIDGLTKNYRYPGWRVGWVVAPEPMIESMARASSAIDGGPSRPSQRIAMDALEPSQADQETDALRDVFAEKRAYMLESLRDLGVRFDFDPRGTFYCWGSLEDLPEPFNDAMTFFWKALEHRVMTVPGQFFDVNPGAYRQGAYRRGKSPYEQWMRFSFGPPMDNMQQGLARLHKMLSEDSSEKE